jgi:hypothetical protein
MVLELSHKADVLDAIKAGNIGSDVTAIIEKVAAEVAKRVNA